MLKVTIDNWKMAALFKENEALYDKLVAMPKGVFINPPDYTIKTKDDSTRILEGYRDTSFYANDFNALDPQVLKYCQFEPVESAFNRQPRAKTFGAK